jgi:heptosyltransferase II
MLNAPNNQKVLVVSPSWVGDVVMTQSLFKLIKKRNPNAAIHVLALQNLHSLLTFMPEVSEVLTLPFKHGSFEFTARWRFGKNLRNSNYTQAILIPNTWKSAIIPFAAKIPLRTGWQGEMRYGLLNDIRKLNTKQFNLMYERFAALGLASSGEALPATEQLWPQLLVTVAAVEQTLQKLHLAKPIKPVLALCPGGELGPIKRWPAAYFAAIAKAKIAEGYDVWIFGGTHEQPLAAIIQNENANLCVDLTGKTSLNDAIALLSLAKVVVSNDSGLMHLAAALNLPVVAIFGGTSWRITPPLTVKAKIITLELPCSPCHKTECQFGHYKCLTGITPSMVYDAIKDLLQKVASGKENN